MQSGSAKGVWIKPCYYDEVSMTHHLGVGVFYQESHFSENVVETTMDAADVDNTIKKLDDEDQCQLYYEAFKWMNFK